MVKKGAKLKFFKVTGITKKGKRVKLGGALGFKRKSALKEVRTLWRGRFKRVDLSKGALVKKKRK